MNRNIQTAEITEDGPTLVPICWPTSRGLWMCNIDGHWFPFIAELLGDEYGILIPQTEDGSSWAWVTQGQVALSKFLHPTEHELADATLFYGTHPEIDLTPPPRDNNES